MKLVAAKCPNCGSNLKVNPKQETIKCEYCESAILIDDAIAKYKVELSGEVEVKNLPKIGNYLELAERNYKNKNYDEAYKQYGKVLELAPNHPMAIIKYGICKTLLNNYVDFSMEYLINSFFDTIQNIENDNGYDIESIVKETTFATDESLYALRKYYNTYTVNATDLANIQIKLMSILLCYETVLDYTDEKGHIIEQIISVLRDLIKDKNYKTGSSMYGGDFYETYKINYGDKAKLTKKLLYYEKLSNPLKEDNIVTETKQEQTKKKIVTKTTQKKAKNKWITLLLWALFGPLCVYKFYEGKTKEGIVYFFTLGLFYIGWLIDFYVIIRNPNHYYPV